MHGTPSTNNTTTTTTKSMRGPMKEKGTLETPPEDIRVAEGEDLRTPGKRLHEQDNRTNVHHDVKLDVTSTMTLNWMFVRNDVKLQSSAKTLN